jgi:hypothetical protein
MGEVRKKCNAQKCEELGMCSRQKFNTPKFIWQASRVHKVKNSAGKYTGKFTRSRAQSRAYILHRITQKRGERQIVLMEAKKVGRVKKGIFRLCFG